MNSKRGVLLFLSKAKDFGSEHHLDNNGTFQRRTGILSLSWISPPSRRTCLARTW